MIQIERKAFYNLLRLNWELDSSLEVQPWQVEDYRILPIEVLFNRLSEFGITLNRSSFINHADHCESPEELTDVLVGEDDLSTEEQDELFLSVFDIWRRLMSEKPSLSILGDELDYQINLYDNEKLITIDSLKDVLNKLHQVLDDSVFSGIESQEALKLVSVYCANDLESFLYDLIATQIDEDDKYYAKEIFEQFSPYLEESKWFDLLKLRFSEHSDLNQINQEIQAIVSNYLGDRDCDFNLDFLTTLLSIDSTVFFARFAIQTASLIEIEEDFLELLLLCIEYFEVIEKTEYVEQLQDVLNMRKNNLEDSIDPKDKDLIYLLKILQ
jgi:hypothetical protein